MLTTAPRSEDVLLSLHGGATCLASVWDWMVEASFRLTFKTLSDGRLHVSPREAITLADAAFIKAHKAEILAAVRHVDAMCRRPL